MRMLTKELNSPQPSRGCPVAVRIEAELFTDHRVDQGIGLFRKLGGDLFGQLLR